MPRSCPGSLRASGAPNRFKVVYVIYVWAICIVVKVTAGSVVSTWVTWLKKPLLHSVPVAYGRTGFVNR